MKSRNLLLALAALFCILTLEGCIPVAAVGVGMGMVSAFDRRTTGAQVDDEGLELRVSNRINERFGDRAHVNVTSVSYTHLTLPTIYSV